VVLDGVYAAYLSFPYVCMGLQRRDQLIFLSVGQVRDIFSDSAFPFFARAHFFSYLFLKFPFRPRTKRLGFSYDLPAGQRPWMITEVGNPARKGIAIMRQRLNSVLKLDHPVSTARGA
jgi:hypothetical protein